MALKNNYSYDNKYSYDLVVKTEANSFENICVEFISMLENSFDEYLRMLSPSSILVGISKHI